MVQAHLYHSAESIWARRAPRVRVLIERSPHTRGLPASRARKASLLSGWIFSVFRDRSPEVMLQLFKALVRPILEYCCLVWNPSKTGDIQAIENVQRCFTRRLDGMQGLDYWGRFKSLKLMSLQRRRQRYTLMFGRLFRVW